jgi:riboflavin biosynthesis pyrimidine reductase
MLGVREIESSTRTTHWRGTYDEDPHLRGDSSRCAANAAWPDMAEDNSAHPASGTRTGSLEPLELLYEEAGRPSFGLPPALATAYSGDLGFTAPCVYANFVASIDGVVALGPEHPSSGSAISGHEPADRFVMGLLRACADAVLIGAGTLRATPRHRWTPDHVYPQAASDFAELRRSLRRATQPQLVVVTASGEVPTENPALQSGALVATTADGARRLEGRLPPTCAISTAVEGSTLRMADVLATLSAQRHISVLTEGGPQLIGHLLGEGLLDELFLTTSPVLAGRAGTSRPGLRTRTAAEPAGVGRADQRPATGLIPVPALPPSDPPRRPWPIDPGRGARPHVRLQAEDIAPPALTPSAPRARRVSEITRTSTDTLGATPPREPAVGTCTSAASTGRIAPAERAVPGHHRPPRGDGP